MTRQMIDNLNTLVGLLLADAILASAFTSPIGSSLILLAVFAAAVAVTALVAVFTVIDWRNAR